MGYIVRSLAVKKRSWKLQFTSYKGGGQKTRDIPEEEYARHGFRPDMTIEEARGRRDQLNAQRHLVRQEERRQGIARRLAAEARVLDAFLDAGEVAEFESEVLFAHGSEFADRNKTESHWRAAKRILCKIRLEPKDYNTKRVRFFVEFQTLALSPSYVRKILRIVNLWGYFQARRHGTFYEPIKAPRGHERERIADAYYAHNEHGGESAPLTPKKLEQVKEAIRPEWYNWFYLSVWFGLRPSEVDLLTKPEGIRTWQIVKISKVQCLSVYQTKLTAVPRDKRTKFIPCIVPEQVAGLAIIRKGNIKRPSHSRHFKPYLGDDVTLYGGRKGFEDLMRGYGQRLEDIASWMGHQSIERTWRNYRNKTAVRFEPVKK